MSEKRATREALGETLVELVAEGVDVVAVDADLSGSTTTAKLAQGAPGAILQRGHRRAEHDRHRGRARR